MAAHEYWRINVTANNGSGSVAVAEFEMRATVSGADQLSGGTATASSSGGFNPPTRAADDDPATFWRTNSIPTGWWRYQFASPVEVAEYTIQSTATATPPNLAAPQDWTLEFSDNGTDWTVVDTRSAETGWGANEIRTYEVTAAPPTATRVAIATTVIT